MCNLRVTGGPCDACIGAGFVPVALTPQPIPAASNSHYISNGLRVVSGALFKLRLRGGRGGVALSLCRSGALALCRCSLFAGLDRRGLARMFWARRDADAVNYRFLACLVANLDPNTRARHGVLGAGRAMELAHRKWGATFDWSQVSAKANTRVRRARLRCLGHTRLHSPLSHACLRRAPSRAPVDSIVL